MKTTAFTLTFFTLLCYSISNAINFKNNACTKLLYYPIAPFSPKCYENPDVLSNIPEMVERNNFRLETYSVLTDDGYVLSLFRIKRKQETSPTKNFAVFMMHGITVNTDSWVCTHQRSLAFYLMDLGYDVWMGTVRGAKYAHNHLKLSVNNPNFWNFTLDKVAAGDVMKQLNFVAKTSGKKIHYIGHSMGTTVAFMYVSSFEKEAHNMIQSLSLLAPVVYLDGVKPLNFAKTPLLLVAKILELLRIRGLFYHENLIHTTLRFVCGLLPSGCYLIFVTLIFGKSTHFASEDLLVYMSYYPSGTSEYQLEQYLQIVKSKSFQKYDYGRKGNLKEYGTEKPPVYDLSKVKLPVALYYGQNDRLYSKQNLERLFNEIGSTEKTKYSIPLNSTDYYQHVDFLHGKTVDTDLYPLLVDNLKRYEN